MIVDDHGPFRAVVRDMLERGGFRVVGEAVDGPTAIEVVDETAPDVVLLDVHLPGDDGFAVCERLRAGGTAPTIVLTSSHDIRSFRRRLHSSAASGFIAKTELSAGALAALLDGVAP